MNEDDIKELNLYGQIYFRGELMTVSALSVDIYENTCISFKERKDQFSFKHIMHELSFDKPKEKVKRAKYLVKRRNCPYPHSSGWYYKDQNDFLYQHKHKKEDYDFIIRLNETEREFDE